MGESLPLFLFSSFNAVEIMFNIFFAHDWIRTVELLCHKRPLYQLSQIHCTIFFILLR